MGDTEIRKSGKFQDPLWAETTKVWSSGKAHPVVTCNHCEGTWNSKARDRLESHLRRCQNLPERLWARFQPEKAGLPPLGSRQQIQDEHPSETPIQPPNVDTSGADAMWMLSGRQPTDTPNETIPGPMSLSLLLGNLKRLQGNDSSTRDTSRSNKRKRDPPDVDTALKRLAVNGRTSRSWRADADIVVESCLSLPSTNELAPVRASIRQLGGEAKYADEAMSSIRYAWHMKLAEALGEMITYEADAVRAIGNVLKIAEERQAKGFGRRVLKKLEGLLPTETTPAPPPM